MAFMWRTALSCGVRDVFGWQRLFWLFSLYGLLYQLPPGSITLSALNIEYTVMFMLHTCA